MPELCWGSSVIWASRYRILTAINDRGSIFINPDALTGAQVKYTRVTVMGIRAAATLHQSIDRGNFCSGFTKWRTIVAISKGQPICRLDRLADFWWQVELGAARQVHLQSNGQRCIHEFFLRREWFMSDNISEDTVIEAVCDGTLLARYRRSELELLAAEDRKIAEILHEARIAQAARAEQHIFNLWHQRSVEKVRVFLDQMSARMPVGPDGFIPLPMSRYDIADYLGLSVETVSRALTTLRTHSVLEFDGVRKLRIARLPMATSHLPCPPQGGGRE